MKTFKYLSFIALTCATIFSFGFTTSKTPNPNKAIYEILEGFRQQDSAQINKYIDRELGLIVLFRPGAINTFGRTDCIDFDNPVPSYYPYIKIDEELKIRSGNLPIFSCDTERWNKTGIYCGRMGTDRLTSSIAGFLKDEGMIELSTEEMQEIVSLENNSRRIAAVDMDGNDIIFYLTLINNKWHLTIIDRLSSDCSA